MFLLILPLSYLTHERNNIWRDPETLWTDAAKKSTGKARPKINLARVLINKKEYLARHSAIARGRGDRSEKLSGKIHARDGAGRRGPVG